MQMDDATRIAYTSRVYAATLLRTVAYALRVTDAAYGGLDSNEPILKRSKDLQDKIQSLLDEHILDLPVDMADYAEAIEHQVNILSHSWIDVWKKDLMFSKELNNQQKIEGLFHAAILSMAELIANIVGANYRYSPYCIIAVELSELRDILVPVSQISATDQRVTSARTQYGEYIKGLAADESSDPIWEVSYEHL